MILGKACSRCREWKIATEFGRNRSCKDGLQSYCKPCRTEYFQESPTAKQKTREQARRWTRQNPEGRSEIQRKYRQNNKEKLKQKNRDARLSRYGLTEKEFDVLLAAQDDRCAICHRSDPGAKGWNIDHCHNTGRVRGLLCGWCNRGLGQFSDDPALLRLALAYLELYPVNQQGE